jgi:protein-tyrosine-phosphatase
MAASAAHPLPRRRFLALLATLVGPAGRAQAAACDPPRVLFVCPVGTVKSAIARETLRRRAGERGVAVVVQSRGVHPADHVTPALAANLKADGVDPTADPLRPLTAADVRAADITIAFDEAAQAPELAGARIWTTPSWNSDYAAAKADLAPRIEALLDELSARGCRSAGR